VLQLLVFLPSLKKWPVLNRVTFLQQMSLFAYAVLPSTPTQRQCQGQPPMQFTLFFFSANLHVFLSFFLVFSISISHQVQSSLPFGAMPLLYLQVYGVKSTSLPNKHTLDRTQCQMIVMLEIRKWILNVYGRQNKALDHANWFKDVGNTEVSILILCRRPPDVEESRAVPRCRRF